MTESELKPIIEALIYIAEEPITEPALVDILGKENKDLIRTVIARLLEEYQSSERGLEIKEIASGYKMATKPEHHEWIRNYVKRQTPSIRLSLAALETLAVIAYKQPITIPEIQEIRGVNAVGVLKTLIDKKLVTASGRKNVIGRPILYKTTREFLMHFGLKGLDELPSLGEFEELAQSAFGNGSSETADSAPETAQSVDSAPDPAAMDTLSTSEVPATSDQPMGKVSAAAEIVTKESRSQIA